MTRNLIRFAAALLAASTVLVAVSASAQDDDDNRNPREPVTEHTFEDADEIVGDTPGAHGIRTTVRLPGARESLIRYRTHFRDSLLKSVEIL